MPFVALAKNGADVWQRVDITDFESPKQALKGYELKCQVCGFPMTIKHTILISAHFAHLPNLDRDCAYEHEGGASPEHYCAQREIIARLKQHSAYGDAELQKEVYIKSINRIADIMVTFPDGEHEVHEVQLSRISIEDLEQRTIDYREAGCNVVWWLGNNANTETNRQWIRNQLGYCTILETSTRDKVLDL